MYGPQKDCVLPENTVTDLASCRNRTGFALLCSPITGNVGTNANFTISKRTTRNYVKFSKSLQCILRARLQDKKLLTAAWYGGSGVMVLAKVAARLCNSRIIETFLCS